LLTFGRKTLGEAIPPSRLGPVRRGAESDEREPPRAVVSRCIYDRDRATLGVAIDPPDDELPDEATWRIDLSRTKFRDCVSKTPSPRRERRRR